MQSWNGRCCSASKMSAKTRQSDVFALISSHTVKVLRVGIILRELAGHLPPTALWSQREGPLSNKPPGQEKSEKPTKMLVHPRGQKPGKPSKNVARDPRQNLRQRNDGSSLRLLPHFSASGSLLALEGHGKGHFPMIACHPQAHSPMGHEEDVGDHVFSLARRCACRWRHGGTMLGRKSHREPNLCTCAPSCCEIWVCTAKASKVRCELGSCKVTTCHAC